jgi:hypothetical protein
MKLKLVVAICALAAMPAFVQAKHGDTPPTAPRPAMAQVQKVMQIIKGNKTKLQQYCEIAKLDPQIVEAEQKQDINRLNVLVKRADDLAKKIGPEYVAMLEDGVENDRGRQVNLAALREGLAKLGWMEGRNLTRNPSRASQARILRVASRKQAHQALV